MGIILTASLLPVLLLMLYIYRRDTFNKEPLRLLIKAFVFGILSAFLDVIMVSIFSSIIPHLESTPLNDALFSAFVEAAMPEEFCKLLMLYLCIWKNPYFDEYYDGIEYCTFVGLGFAGIENVLYVLQGGLGVAVGRAVSAVPAHFFFAIFMGYFFSLARFRRKGRTFYFFLAYLIPVLLHGTYDFLLMYASNISEMISESAPIITTLYTVFFAFFFIIWRQAIKRVKRMSGK